MMRARSWRLLVPAILAVGLVVGGPAGPALGAAPVTFSSYIGPCFLSGSGAAVPFRVVHRSSTGALKGTYLPTYSGFPSTNWSVSCPGKTILPGDTLRFLDLTDPENPTINRTFKVPAFTAVTDRIRNRVSGVAKGTPSLPVSLQDCMDGTTGCSGIDGGTVTAGGAYVYAPALDATGSTVVTLIWTNGQDSLYLQTGFPKLVTTLGAAAVSGIGSPGQGVTVTVTHAGKDGTLARTVSVLRTFKGKVARKGVAQKLAVGDRVRWSLGTKLQADFIVPDASMVIGPAHTTGFCFPNSTVVIVGTKPDKTQSVFNDGPTGPDGSFNVTINISSGWLVKAMCKTTAGDVVQIDGIAGT